MRKEHKELYVGDPDLLHHTLVRTIEEKYCCYCLCGKFNIYFVVYTNEKLNIYHYSENHSLTI